MSEPLTPTEQRWLEVDRTWRDRMARRLREQRAVIAGWRRHAAWQETEYREAIRQRDELRRVLERLVAWAERSEWSAQATLAHAHGFRVSDDVHAEGAALWKDLERLLGR